MNTRKGHKTKQEFVKYNQNIRNETTIQNFRNTINLNVKEGYFKVKQGFIRLFLEQSIKNNESYIM